MSIKKLINIDGKKIGREYAPYIIAEVSANHNGKIENAFKLIELAKECGASAVKFQTYTPDTITLNEDSEDFKIKKGLWAGKTLYALYGEAFLPWEWHAELFDYAKKIGITAFSSVFDSSSVDFLETLGCPAYKIASFEAVDLPLIRYAASTGKPLIISTGMATKEEIEEAVMAAKQGGCKELAILHCVSGYPAKAEEYNLLTIEDLIQSFDLVTGLSDHTIENITAVTSIALGASIVEKHFTLNRDGGGPDDSFSIEPDGLAELSRQTLIAWQSLGGVDYAAKESEKENTQFRRSIYFVNDIKKGEVVRQEDIRSIRPGYGVAPKDFDLVVNRRVKADVPRGTPVKWEILE